jgi:hypothetical protein
MEVPVPKPQERSKWEGRTQLAEDRMLGPADKGQWERAMEKGGWTARRCLRICRGWKHFLRIHLGLKFSVVIS